MAGLGMRPRVGRGVRLRDCLLGKWTELGDFCALESTWLGDYSYMGQLCIAQNAKIGAFSNIAACVRIGPTDHPMERASLHHFTYRRSLYGFGPDDEEFFERRAQRVCEIGPDTWVGHGAIILAGRKVGVGAVVGAGSVVTKDVGDYCVVVGVPAKVLRRRCSEDQADALRRIAWWEWGHETIKSREPDFHLSLADFIAKYDGGPA